MNITSKNTMIQWRLRHIMADQMLTNKELAERLGKHPNSIGNLKNTDTMPRIDGETLNSLCLALRVTPSDLIRFVPDHDAA